ncbi:class I lanthipeptide [Mucilaginibacter sp. BT774]|uniref:class I lanthipeptide n=1 Tax=Mucilaginibacter sp. BT774 TaxID=3062276 RepID=UPI0034A04D93
MKEKALKKLTLNKSVIAKLTEDEQANVKGGDAITTSGNCTGFLCCNKSSQCQTNVSNCCTTSVESMCVGTVGCP